MLGGNRFGEKDGAFGGLLVLIMVVEGSHAPDTPSGAVFLTRVLEIEPLHEDGEALHEENAAEKGQEQFLTHKDCAHANHAANCETSRVSHKYLGGERVVPQESYECPNEGAHEDGNLSTAGNIHDVKVVRVYQVAPQPSQDA